MSLSMSSRPRGRARLALAALFVLGACSTEDGDGDTASKPGAAAAAQAAPGQPGAAGTKRPIAVTCALGDDIDAADKDALVASASEWVDALRSDRHDSLWQALHPQAKRPEDRPAFLDTLGALSARLKDASAGAPVVELVAHGRVTGGVNDLARMVCRTGDDAEAPPDLTVLINAGGEDVGYVSLLVPGPVYEHAAVLQLRKRETWRLLGVQVHPSRYRGRSANEWVGLAGRLRRAGKFVPAYTALAMAGAMASRGPSVTTPISAAIEADLETLRAHPLFIAETKAWTIDGQDFDLHGLSLAATQTDVSLVVKYVNQGGLVEELVGRDADKLMDHVRTQYPELTDIVDAVIFEAYATPPTKPGATVDAFRVARVF